MIRFAHGAATDVGRVRSGNEDSFLVAEALFAVADGMGGHRGGEVASATALETLRISILEPNAEALRAAAEAANRAVFDQSLTDPELAGMGTTLCGIALVRDHEGRPSIGIVNVGDSRVYLLRGGQFRQLTLDHSLVETMVRGGQISADEAATHPGRNVLTRALGIEPDIEVDLFSEPVLEGDRYLLCSDGLYNELHDDQVSAVLRRLAAPWEAASELVRLATEAGGRDNVTVVIADVLADEGDGPVDGLIGTTVASPTPPEEDPLGLSAPRTEQLPVVKTPDSNVVEPTATEPTATAATSRPRITWRVWAFVAAVIVVFGVAIGAVLASRGGDEPRRTTTSTSSSSSSSSSTSSSTTTAAAGEPSTSAPTPTQAPAPAAPAQPTR
ncbi:MAG: Stp1/IreP family PP2C-type Ser/Thr phosphatase [Microthrixaceae bacterium]|nr:Stp1/IreP family PP2C-type Ser/Thr phosphatase [Microthrixaceae bacterium]